MPEIKPLQIDKNEEKTLPSDFSLLRLHALEWIRQLSGDTWTDHNLHDPGITILEMLCYAITDLSYRTEFPLEQLLADEQGWIDEKSNAFFRKEDILTVNPVTINDLRKAILDETDELSNIWFEPVYSSYSSDTIKGVYMTYVQPTEEVAGRLGKDKTLEKKIKDTIKRSFLSKRNICEDIVRDIILLTPVSIGITAEVVIEDNMLPEEILACIYDTLRSYLHPPLRVATEKELQDHGQAIEDIYAGPPLGKGLLSDKGLGPQLREIDPLSLINIITKVKGVILVRNLVLTGNNHSSGILPLQLDSRSFPLLDPDSGIGAIRFFKNKYEVPVRETLVKDLMMKFRQRPDKVALSPLKPSIRSQFTGSTNPDIERYYSIQDHFPVLYGIGKEGLPSRALPGHKAQARQLKAYLFFFEQILADYLSQLAHLRHFFSIDTTPGEARTYYYQPLYDIPEVAPLLKDFTDNYSPEDPTAWERFKKDTGNGYIQAVGKAIESVTTYRNRKNAVLDHMLARFNESPDDYPVVLYTLLYGDPTEDKKINALLRWKSEIIKNMVELSRDRVKGFDYVKDNEAPYTITGFENKMHLLLYMRHIVKRSLTSTLDPQKIKLHFEKGIPEAEGHRQQNAFIWEDQSISLFRYGIDPANYSIHPDPHDTGKHLILYKEPEETHWKTLGWRSDHSAALQATQQLMSLLKQISIGSEGFHLVEHTLLRPPLAGKSFGFGFYTGEKELLLEHGQWLSFEERENTIRQLLELGSGDRPETETMIEKLSGLCKIYVRENDNFSYPIGPEEMRSWKKEDQEKKIGEILENLGLYNRRGLRFFPKFEMLTRQSHRSAVREDFFNFRMSVVLPVWPARCQVKNFRDFTEDLFRKQAPAHIRIRCRWLGISEMIRFERIYFNWLNLFRQQEGNLDSCEESHHLIEFLKDDAFKWS